ncbi:hypothetical protein [uncultured Candidatus Thioglobus sp.]|jgi:hypothetical protein|uniref:hypothetical protein n=1 Tax=uncultured Candidatus Thioglobus sp. TaxID=655186 RepID=UPI001EBDC280|nr:hypothetical protein [Candidatus Thioglobus sp.]MBT6655544.1 hypothetical protein [Candidatus Thioglobus sp.]MBT7498026.1 hypothetical protein [Candidatus Thioglobus sp.]
MIRRSKGHAVVEVMNIELELRAAFSKLVSAMAFYNEDDINMDKVKAQFKEMTNRTIRDFNQDMLTFPPEMDSERTIERRHYTR